jgi:hypothetical protein
VYTPLVKINCLSKKNIESIEDFIKKLDSSILSFKNFQHLYCLTEAERAGRVGPLELLTRVKRFLEKEELKRLDEEYIECKGAPFKLPARIAIGYFMLTEIIKKMEVLSCKKT